MRRAVVVYLVESMFVFAMSGTMAVVPLATAKVGWEILIEKLLLGTVVVIFLWTHS